MHRLFEGQGKIQRILASEEGTFRAVLVLAPKGVLYCAFFNNGDMA